MAYIRYIRDRMRGNSVNGGNHWIELQALGDDGTNYALNKTVTGNTEAPAEGNYSVLVDGKTGEGDTYLNPRGIDAWVMVDLGQLYDVRKIVVYPYYADHRTYYNTETSVSLDGKTWTVINKEASRVTSSSGTSMMVTFNISEGGY